MHYYVNKYIMKLIWNFHISEKICKIWLLKQNTKITGRMKEIKEFFLFSWQHDKKCERNKTRHRIEDKIGMWNHHEALEDKITVY